MMKDTRIVNVNGDISALQNAYKTMPDNHEFGTLEILASSNPKPYTFEDKPSWDDVQMLFHKYSGNMKIIYRGGHDNISKEDRKLLKITYGIRTSWYSSKDN